MSKLIRLYNKLKLKLDNIVELDIDQSHYIINVMRKSRGDNIKLFNNDDGEWQAEIIDITRKKVNVRIFSQIKSSEKEENIDIIFSLIKNSRIPYIVEKSTELGVANLFPIISDRSNNKSINIKKFTSISIEAAEQSERINIPTIHEVKTLKLLLSDWDESNTILFCDENRDTIALNQLLVSYNIKDKFTLLIGPEGGFSTEERLYLRSLSFVKSIHLGKYILRSETAAIAALAYIKIFANT